MTKHKATPEQWAQIELQAQHFNDDSCLIELRDRVEALEAAQRPTVKDSLTVPADSLVGRVADAIYSKWGMTANLPAGHPYKEETRAAILAVSDWLYQQELHIAATRLRMEVR
jgi:hypothetical protein